MPKSQGVAPAIDLSHNRPNTAAKNNSNTIIDRDRPNTTNKPVFGKIPAASAD